MSVIWGLEEEISGLDGLGCCFYEERREERGWGWDIYVEVCIVLYLIGNNVIYLELKFIIMVWIGEKNVVINLDIVEIKIERKEKNLFYIG